MALLCGSDAAWKAYAEAQRGPNRKRSDAELRARQGLRAERFWGYEGVGPDTDAHKRKHMLWKHKT